MFQTAALKGVRLLFVGGKGGVGKTTVAAAIALRVARDNPARSVLLLSTDPAHSVGDVLATRSTDQEKPVPGGPANLAARELDAAGVLAAKRAAMQTALDEIAASLGTTIDAASFLDMAPPGIDELFGMLSLVSSHARHDLTIVDTAPTGHALRLLEMPDAAREWTRMLLRVLLKYRSIVRPGAFAKELVDASQSIRALQAMMMDSHQSRFVVVTRATAVARVETERLLLRLRRLRLSTPWMIVNARTLSPGRCRRCRATTAAERREVAALVANARKTVGRGGCAIIEAPLVAPPPRGPAALEQWSQFWIR